MADLKIIETGDGGDVVFIGTDIQTIEGFQNMPYLAMFGGNPDQITTGAKDPENEAFDFPGNFVLNPNNPAVWFNSLTEKFLKNVALTPASLTRIENVVKEDVNFMREFSSIRVSATLPTVDVLRIDVFILEQNAVEENQFSYIWDATKNELKQFGQIIAKIEGFGIGFPFVLGFNF